MYDARGSRPYSFRRGDAEKGLNILVHPARGPESPPFRPQVDDAARIKGMSLLYPSLHKRKETRSTCGSLSCQQQASAAALIACRLLWIRHHPETRRYEREGGNRLRQTSRGSNHQGCQSRRHGVRARIEIAGIDEHIRTALVELAPGTVSHAAERRSRKRCEGPRACDGKPFYVVERGI